MLRKEAELRNLGLLQLDFPSPGSGRRELRFFSQPSRNLIPTQDSERKKGKLTSRRELRLNFLLKRLARLRSSLSHSHSLHGPWRSLARPSHLLLLLLRVLLEMLLLLLRVLLVLLLRVLLVLLLGHSAWSQLRGHSGLDPSRHAVEGLRSVEAMRSSSSGLSPWGSSEGRRASSDESRRWSRSTEGRWSGIRTRASHRLTWGPSLGVSAHRADGLDPVLLLARLTRDRLPVLRSHNGVEHFTGKAEHGGGWESGF